MPTWGMQMEEGKIVKWLVAEGGRVAEGDPIVEVETEKITNVVEASATGILAKIVATEGMIIKVTGLLAVITEAGENASSVEAIVAAAQLKGGGAPSMPQPPVDAAPGNSPPAASGGKVAQKLRASPIAKRIADEKGVDLNLVVGSGPEGRISKEDVLAWIEQRASQVNKAKASILSPQAFEGVIVPLSQMRKVIVRRTSESIKAPQGTLTREVDLSTLLNFRKAVMPEYQKRYALRLALTPMFIKAVAMAAKEVPILNSRLDGDNIYISHKVHVGVVVGLEGSIVIPVVFDAQAKSVAQIAKEWDDLAARAAQGKLNIEEITGGTITISNVGNAGIDVFTPILNPPEAACLGITRTRQRPVVRDGRIEIGEMAYLCLTGDHRVMDAEPIGRFLAAIDMILQNPVSLLV